MKVTELLENQHQEPLVVSLLRKLLKARKSVVFSQGGNEDFSVFDVQTDVTPSGRPFVEIFFTNDSAIPYSSMWRGDEKISQLQLKKEGDHWRLIDQADREAFLAQNDV